MIPSDETARAIVTHLAEIVIYSLVIYLAILAFRAVFREKASPALRYGLWFLLLLRLTVPVTAASAFHLIVLPEPAPEPTPIPAQAVPAAARTTALPQASVRPVLAEGNRTPLPLREEVPAAAAPARFRPSVWHILLAVWIVGTALCLGRKIWMLALLQSRLRHSATAPEQRTEREFRAQCNRMRIRGDVRLLVVEDITSPALTIALRPQVLLPAFLAGADRKKERRLAVRHELTHRKRGDHLVMLWFGLLRSVWWFFPVLWLMEKPFRMDMESACDAMAVVGMSRDDKLFYATLLLELGKDGAL